MKFANGDSCVQELSDMKESIFSTDVCMNKLENQLRIVVDVIRVELPEVKKLKLPALEPFAMPWRSM